MIAETRHCLRNLTNLHGRDSRQTFWYYVIALIVLQVVVGVIATVPLFVGMVSDMFALASEGAEPEQLASAMMASMGPLLKNQVLISAVLAAISAALFVAAFVRRLHDAGKPGWIVLIPLATSIFAQVLAFSQIDQMLELMQVSMESAVREGGEGGMPAGAMQQAMAMQQQTQSLGVIGWIGYLVVIVFGAMQSTPGPNRYGEGPAVV